MKTLVIRLSSIGDILLATPVVRCLHRAFPEGRIDFCAFDGFAELLEGNPYISHVIAMNRSLPLAEAKKRILADGKYDNVIDLHNNFRSLALRRYAGENVFVVNKRTFRRWLLVKTKINLLHNAPDVRGRYFEAVRQLGVRDDGEGLDFFAAEREEDRIVIARIMRDHPFTVGLCPGANHFTKRWLPERYAELALRLIRGKNARIVLFGGASDTALCARIRALIGTPASESVADASGTLTLAGTALAIRRCAAVVTNDSGLMHLAASQHAPLVAVFGSTVKEFGFFPSSPRSAVLETPGLACRPCTHIGRHACPKGHFRCMGDITAARAADALERILA